MKPKIRTSRTTYYKILSRWWRICAFLFVTLLFCIPLKSNATDDSSVPKIKLNIGDVLHYQVEEIGFYENRTTKSRKLVELEVIDKKDTIYTIVCRLIKKETANNKVYTNSDYNSTQSNWELPELNKPFPFFLSENGLVQPVTIPDSIVSRKIKEEYEFDILRASTLINNLNSNLSLLQNFFQQFFFNWNSIYLGEKIVTNQFAKTNVITKDISLNRDYSHLKIETKSVPIYSGTDPALLTWSEGTLDLKTNIKTGTLVASELSSTNTKYELRNINHQVDVATKSSIKIQQYDPVSESVAIITGTLDKNCTPQNLRCFIYNNFIGSNGPILSEEIMPGESFNYKIPIKNSKSVSLLLDGMPNSVFGNFLIEPGDSINLDITPNNIDFSGKGALKNKLYKAMRENYLGMYSDFTESMAKQEAAKWISSEQQKIEPFKEQISWWAYNQIRCDIYYAAMNRMQDYYFQNNNRQPNVTSFNLLFNDVKWEDYSSVTSIDMFNFIDNYLYRKLLILKNAKANITVTQTERYNLASLIFNEFYVRIRYCALSQCVFEALKSNSITEGKNLFALYEKEYRKTGYYSYLKEKLESRVDLGEGSVIPEFNATDITGKKISLEKLKGKYVQLLFINLEWNDTTHLSAYQRLKEALPNDKFEMITVFVNKDDSLTNDYIRKNHPKGILIKNPDWHLDQLKKFDAEASSPYYLVNQKGNIVFAGAGYPANAIVETIIRMINNDNFSKAEASISKRTLYWVLLLSVLVILGSFGVFVIVTNGIKRRENFRSNQLELKLSAVRSQLNPHFLFNSMTSIQYLVNHNENEKANLFLSKFAQLMRKVLFQSEIERIPLKEELATIETYLELEALRHRFSYKINIEEGIDLYNTEIPVMLLQPFVENAVIHGISKLGEKGTIEIRVEKSETHQLKISIIDNGTGYTNGNTANAISNGKGMQITRKRIDLMMAKYGHEIDFNVRNRKEINASLTGTEVEITFETEA